MHRERKRERGESARVGVGAREGDRYVETGEVGDGDREGITILEDSGRRVLYNIEVC